MPIHDSLAELLAEISERGRDSFVAGLAKNRDIYGYTPGPWRKREEKDGIVYLVMCLKDLKVYVGQTNDVDRRLCEHLGGYGGAEGLANAIKKHHRNNFVCMILLAGLPNQEALDSAEIKVIAHLDCFIQKGGYNIKTGGKGVGAGGIKGKKLSELTKKRIGDSKRGKKRGKKVNEKAVVITIIRTGEEVSYSSVNDAAMAMCVSPYTINSLARKKTNKSKWCNGGRYAHRFFTARFSD